MSSTDSNQSYVFKVHEAALIKSAIFHTNRHEFLMTHADCNDLLTMIKTEVDTECWDGLVSGIIEF